MGWEGIFPEAEPGSSNLTGQPNRVLTWPNSLARYESKLISMTGAGRPG